MMGIMIRTDGNSSQPLFRQIMDQVVGLVEAGALEPGSRLPSTRVLAERLGVNRSTVYKAYQELWALGYLDSRPGSYSTIRKRVRLAAGGPGEARGLIDWSKRSSDGARRLFEESAVERAYYQKTGGPDAVDFVPLSPDPRLFPRDAFRKCMNHVLAGESDALLQYGDARGYRPLREFVARRMLQHGMKVTPDEVLMTTGAQSGIDLVLRLLADPGDAVVFEAPTYSRALDAFRLHGVRMAAVPMTEGGMDLEVLDRVLADEAPAMVYTIPNFHNPTGITTDQGHREALLRICERHRTPLVEDGFEEEMKYFGRAVLPIKSMDRHGVVIYLGTFSKILFPGLRIGWIAADGALIERLLPVLRASRLSGSQLDQAAVDRFCRQGFYDLHVKRMHRIYRGRMRTALRAMRENLDPDQVSWTRPAGGYTIWLRVLESKKNGAKKNGAQKGEAGLNDAALAEYLADRGILVAPGRFHYHGPAPGVHFRVSIAHLDESQIEEGIRRLAEALAGWSLTA